ncbi:MAG: surface-adhesin E family protein [Thermodesulfobacteriota bacterium]
MIRVTKCAITILSVLKRKTARLTGGKPAVILLALCLAAPILSCTGKEVEEPAINTDAVTPGVSIPDGTDESERNVASISAEEESRTGSTESPLEDAAPAASHDSESWFLVKNVKAERKFALYVDTSTINTIDGEVYSWSRLIFDEDQKDTDGLIYREVLIASAIDCAGNTYAYKSSKFYDSLGKMVYMENVGTNKSKIPENSVSRYVSDFVCGYNPNDAKKVKPRPSPAPAGQESK